MWYQIKVQLLWGLAWLHELGKVVIISWLTISFIWVPENRFWPSKERLNHSTQTDCNIFIYTQTHTKYIFNKYARDFFIFLWYFHNSGLDNFFLNLYSHQTLYFYHLHALSTADVFFTLIFFIFFPLPLSPL